MNLKLETEFSKAEILQDVDALKKRIDDLRPLPEDVEGNVMQKLRLDWNYHSNAIEGNHLSYGETVAFLMEGITAKGKPLKDHLDIRGHNEAINFLLSIIKDPRPISEADIRTLHQMILVELYDVKAQTADGLPTKKRINLGEYKTSGNHVRTATGETHYYATPEETPAKMQELMEWYDEFSQNEEIHPVVAAALFHHKFVAIHPFDDGNGRLSRILMNLTLMQKGLPPVVIKNDDRQNYYSLLSRADSGDGWPFVAYITERLESSLQLYLKALRGEDIDEDEDINKEIALFKMELQNKTTDKRPAEAKEIYGVIVTEISPLVGNILKKTSALNDLFYKKKNLLNITITNLSDNVKQTHGMLIDNDDYSRYFNAFEYSEYKIESVALYIELLNFKNHENMFNVRISLTFDFYDYDYKISNDALDIVLMKSYNEKLSNEEKKSILVTLIKDLKNLINKNF